MYKHYYIVTNTCGRNSIDFFESLNSLDGHEIKISKLLLYCILSLQRASGA